MEKVFSILSWDSSLYPVFMNGLDFEKRYLKNHCDTLLYIITVAHHLVAFADVDLSGCLGGGAPILHILQVVLNLHKTVKTVKKHK
jgi:hypothetical protein